jgi:polysaccharide biosynthesis protein PslG
MLQAGVLDYADCIGAHHNGYNIGPSVLWNEVDNDSAAEFRGPFDNPHHSWSFRSTLEEYNRKIQLAGGTQKLCITEFGWASTEDLDDTPAGFEFAADNTLDEQAEWTIEALDNMEEWDFVWLAFIWNFNYGPQAGWDPSNDNVPYSIIGPEWVHRPVYDALIEWAAEHNGSES